MHCWSRAQWVVTLLISSPALLAELAEVLEPRPDAILASSGVELDGFCESCVCWQR